MYEVGYRGEFQGRATCDDEESLVFLYCEELSEVKACQDQLAEIECDRVTPTEP